MTLGWGITNEIQAVMGTKPDGSLRYTVADTHHTHASYKDGNYDGRYAWINDKINSRIARIRLDYFVCDKITELPNVQGFHGIFPDKRDPVDPAINYTTRVFCGGEFASRCPTTARDMDDPDQVPLAVHLRGRRDHGSALAGAAIDGNCDLLPPLTTASWRPPTSTTPRAAPLRRHDVRRADACVFFNIARIEEGGQGRQVHHHRRQPRCPWSTAPRKPTRTPRPP
jgi:nitrous-oxide reductase